VLFASSFTSLATVFVCYSYKPVVKVIVMLLRAKIIFRCVSHRCIEKCLDKKSRVLMCSVLYTVNGFLYKSFRRMCIKFCINVIYEVGYLVVQTDTVAQSVKRLATDWLTEGS
jgi:hypothetical protein